MPMNDIDICKNAQRDKYRKIRAEISPATRIDADLSILLHLTASEEYHRSKTILTYVSVGSEADTRRLIAAALEDGKRVAVPRCVSGTRDMEFYCIDELSELQSGAYGLLEPTANKERLLNDTADSICIVPALAFDASGHRLGYGGGYYDRFLAHYEGIAIGLCFNECFCETLIRNDFDRSVSMVITPRGVINIVQKEKSYE